MFFVENDKMFGLFRRKKEVEKLKAEIQDSFDHVKKDFNKVGDWIKHIDGKHEVHVGDISELRDQLLVLQEELEDVKSVISFFGPNVSGGLSKQPQTMFNKQTAVQAVQTPVQTAVQTAIFDDLTVMERAIIWALMNSEENMKLSYEDLSALLGKDKSTVRGQINALKRKSEGLILEVREGNGKKRLYIPEHMRKIIAKNVKVRVKKGRKGKKK